MNKIIILFDGTKVWRSIRCGNTTNIVYFSLSMSSPITALESASFKLAGKHKDILKLLFNFALNHSDNKMHTYIIADNQDITREGLMAVLKSQDIKNQVETVRGRNELQARLRIYPESIVILDYRLFDFVSVNQFLNMKMGAKKSSWILFSDELEEHFLRQVLLIDPSISVVMKNNPLQNILDAITSATYGETYLCDIAESVLNDSPPQKKESDNLTASEKNILREIALGKTTKEIAFEKHLSFHTVNTHRRNIFRKLAVNNAHEATKYALQAGLLDLMEYYI